MHQMVFESSSRACKIPKTSSAIVYVNRFPSMEQCERFQESHVCRLSRQLALHRGWMRTLVVRNDSEAFGKQFCPVFRIPRHTKVLWSGRLRGVLKSLFGPTSLIFN